MKPNALGRSVLSLWPQARRICLPVPWRFKEIAPRPDVTGANLFWLLDASDTRRVRKRMERLAWEITLCVPPVYTGGSTFVAGIIKSELRRLID